MSGHPILRTMTVAASAALLVSALAGPSLAKPDNGAKAEAKVEAKAERQAEKQARVEARAEAEAEKQAAKVTKKAEKQAAKADRKQARPKAKDVDKAACKDGGWEELVPAGGEPFRNQGQCVKYVVHDGTPKPTETVLVIAYSNLNGTPGYQADGVDVLISQLVDIDGNGVDEGDRIDMGRYPTDIDATAFGNFTVPTHTVTSVGIPDQAGFKVYSSSGTHVWLDFVNAEMYYEENPLTQIRDGFPGYTEALSANTGSASQPDTLVSATYRSRPTNDPFIDVDIY